MISINRKHIGNIVLLTLFFAALLLMLSGCDQNGGITVPSGATKLSVSFKSDDNAGNPPAGLVISEAKALISKVAFEVEGSGSKEVILSAPFTANFSLDGTLKEINSGYLIRDFYTKLRFQIHQVQDGEIPPDPEFKDGTGADKRYSFIVKGTYNGNAFVYKSKKSADIVVNFPATENINLAQMNMTVLFNKTGWFKNGNVNLDPSDAQNENIIDDNLKNSFKQAFVDDARNGQPNH